MDGLIKRHPKLRIGYFSQHQAEELDLTSTPFAEIGALMAKKNPGITEPQIRAKLGSFGFSRDLADNRIASLSGGEKARLMFAMISLDAPHILLLDEPTNHLDLDAREALVQALNDYPGAVVLVSHDPHMVERVADQLWLVKDGAVTPFDGDLQDYRAFVIRSRREDKKDKKKSAPKSETQTAPSAPPAKTPTDHKKTIKLEKDLARLGDAKQQAEQDMAAFFAAGDHAAGAKAQAEFDRITQELTAVEADWLALHA